MTYFFFFNQEVVSIRIYEILVIYVPAEQLIAFTKIVILEFISAKCHLF